MLPLDFHKKEDGDSTDRQGCGKSDRCRNHGKFSWKKRDAKDNPQSAQGTFLWQRYSHDPANAVTELRTSTCGFKLTYLEKGWWNSAVSWHHSDGRGSHPYAHCGTNVDALKTVAEGQNSFLHKTLSKDEKGAFFLSFPM